MLSICIPIYNEVSEKLIFQLQEEIKQIDVTAEIILFDDHSTVNLQYTYQKLSPLQSVRIINSDTNLGRAKARNELARHARYDFLLFIDADSEILNRNFLANYLDAAQKNTVCCGGTRYKQEKPPKAKRLRWKYGHKRESLSATQRLENPWLQFTTHHFLIDKDLFLSIQFDENLTQYGHEDSLFGYELQKRNIPVKHINNPLYHTGLESSQVFLDKTKTGLNNLKQLYLRFGNDPEFTRSIRILRFYEAQKSSGMLWFWSVLYRYFNKAMRRQLKGNNPSIFLFNMYKFSYFVSLIKSK
ncbi:MAG TPA: glycosyltransferase family 2 protein [Bacteroidales bacterium]|nr:glycosyltransferase family 2 protein [Bacteroidales bacterium]